MYESEEMTSPPSVTLLEDCRAHPRCSSRMLEGVAVPNAEQDNPRTISNDRRRRLWTIFIDEFLLKTFLAEVLGCNH
jgi:hypothetical protein